MTLIIHQPGKIPSKKILRDFLRPGVTQIQHFAGAMKRRPKKKEKMKTGILLTLGAVALTAITFNAKANDVVLSPHAAANQIKTVPGTNNDPNMLVANNNGVALSPRAAANQIQTVPTVANDVNPALACRKMMTASPKAIQACESNPAMPGCNTVAIAPLK